MIGTFKDRRTGIAVTGPQGLARLDLLMIDRWAPPEAVHIILGAQDAKIVAAGTTTKVTADGLDPEVDTCVRDAFKTVTFPKTHSGGALVVEATYTATPPTPAEKPAAEP